jgi:hypothetical protein
VNDSERFGRTIRRVVVYALVAVIVGTLLAGRCEARSTAGKPLDFLAFACGGSALAGGHDPYRAEPLRSCEIEALRSEGLPHVDHLAMPAPLPSYALALFALFARLPFEPAALLFTGFLIVALIVTAFTLRELTGFSLLGIFAVLALGDGWVCLAYGQIVPLALMFLCLAARLLAAGRPIGAACCAAAAMIEPHIALPACLALFVYDVRTRGALLCCAAALSALALATAGWATNLEYVTHVLPAHALAESSNIDQFSLTTLLHRCGLDPSVALAYANVSYLGMVAIGLVVAQRLATTTNRRELIVLVPPACALLGEPFLHLAQITVALPAVLVLTGCFAARRTFFGAALLLLAIPWLELAENSLVAMLVAVALTTGISAIVVLRMRVTPAIVTVVVMLALTFGEHAIRTGFPPLRHDISSQLAGAAGNSLLADATWAIWAGNKQSDWWFVASHTPTWLGLGCMLVAIARGVNRQQHPRIDEAGSSRERRVGQVATWLASTTAWIARVSSRRNDDASITIPKV